MAKYHFFNAQGSLYKTQSSTFAAALEEMILGVCGGVDADAEQRVRDYLRNGDFDLLALYFESEADVSFSRDGGDVSVIPGYTYLSYAIPDDLYEKAEEAIDDYLCWEQEGLSDEDHE